MPSMATAVLPVPLQAKLDQLAARRHRLLLVRGVSVVLLTLAGGAGLALAADAWLELPPAVRIVLTSGWLGLAGVAAWFGLLRPLRQSPSAAALAAAVEEAYPRLDERLTSAVELAADARGYHGSPALIGLLDHETDLKTRAIDFGRAAPPRRTERLAAAAAAALLLLAAPALLWPEEFAGLGRRLLKPWDARPAVLP